MKAGVVILVKLASQLISMRPSTVPGKSPGGLMCEQKLIHDQKRERQSLDYGDKPLLFLGVSATRGIFGCPHF